MGRRIRPEFVEVFSPSESTKFPSKVRMSFTEAVYAVREGRGIFRDHRRKIVLAAQPHEPSVSPATRAALTGGGRIKGDGGDMHALAGMHFSGGYLSKRRRERLSGYGLLQEGRT